MPLSDEKPITGTTIFQSAEDGVSDTISLDIDSDCDMIENYIQEINARLFCVDPVQVFMGRSADMGRATDIRRLMTNLSGIAERNNCAVVVIWHLTKNQGSKDL
ncbi:hypothetical protein AGMMS49975_25400 [Clostridia bacterium]|nr:hypothetical protein AGMMS49975_25400 [Clostridia bacterium]